MFANSQFVFFLFFVIFFVGNVYAQKNKIVAADDIVGLNYVDSNDVKEAKINMIEKGDGYGTEWIFMPNGDGDPEIAILSLDWGNKKSKNALDRSMWTITAPPEEVVTLRLFTRMNPDNGIIFDRGNLASLNFNGSQNTKFVIHGWRSSSDSPTVTTIRDAYLETADVNVVTVDWSEPARNIYYPASAAYTKKVGQYVGGIINDLVREKNGKYANFHVIGHSLGAHTAGIAGFSTLEPVARVTGLDPALPGFQDLASREDSLDATDAEFVDVIHTCAGALGMSSPVGHADFYPNGGSPFQPGCCCLTELTGVCSHGRSHEYFAESILSTTAFEGIRCDSWQQFTKNACENLVVPMGEYTPSTTRGVFYLETDSKSPFGLGMEGTKCTNPK